METKLFLAIVVCAAVAFIALISECASQRRNIDALFEAMASTAREVGGMRDKMRDFEEWFNGVMDEAERQNEREAQWNEGLHNILNYCLNDASKTPGGEQK